MEYLWQRYITNIFNWCKFYFLGQHSVCHTLLPTTTKLHINGALLAMHALVASELLYACWNMIMHKYNSHSDLNIHVKAFVK